MLQLCHLAQLANHGVKSTWVSRVITEETNMFLSNLSMEKVESKQDISILVDDLEVYKQFVTQV